MCGFVGFTAPDRGAEAVLEKMMETIRHRGPDSGGSYLDESVALGFRRLSIIDLAGGDQPIWNEDRTKVLLCNGEIYNYRELRQVLIEKGHRFSTASDSEVLLHGYEEYGADLLPKLRGMFAFVLWDRAEKELFGARDPFGIKPFYYAQMNGTLLFASEIKAFLPHPSFRKALDRDVLEQYLTFQFSPLASTLFEGVQKLLPGHFLRFRDGKLTVSCYREVHFEPVYGKTEEDWADELDEIFRDSVRVHQISDVEVGSFLSSGVDSSYVTVCADVGQTFTVGFAGDRYDEIGYAKRCAGFLGMENHEKIITPREYWEALGTVCYHLDEPLADPAAVALYFVSREAAKHVKVTLSGEGADELFGGYNVYTEPSRSAGYCRLPAGLRRAIGEAANACPWMPKRNFLYRHRGDLTDWYYGNPNAGFRAGERKRLLRFSGGESPEELLGELYRKSTGEDPVTRMQELDIRMWLASDILLKSDKMSMANSLEVRVPFLDVELLKLAEGLPAEYRVRKIQTKTALRRAAEKRLPEEVSGKKKLGFPVPVRYWLKEEPYYTVVKKAFHRPIARELFDPGELMRLMDGYREGRHRDYLKIWSVFTFLLWYEEFFEKR